MNQPNPDPRIRVNLNLPLSLRAQLVTAAAQEKRPMADILHEALRDYLDHYHPSV